MRGEECLVQRRVLVDRIRRIGTTGISWKESVFGQGSVFAPPFAVLPLSSTWNVRLGSVPPTVSGGVNTRLPAARSAALTNWPAITATPDKARPPAVGRVVISTAVKTSGGESLGSVKPKSAAAGYTTLPR